MYIPAFFIHAVINLEPVVGFTVELEVVDYCRPDASKWVWWTTKIFTTEVASQWSRWQSSEY